MLKLLLFIVFFIYYMSIADSLTEYGLKLRLLIFFIN